MTQPDDRPLEESVYGPYDPTVIEPAGTPGTQDEGPHVDSEPGAGAPGPDGPLPEFDTRMRTEFSGLLYLGALTDTFDWLGHRFVIRTLRTGELVGVSLAVKDYLGTDGYLKAWQCAMVGACVVSVDGRPLPPLPLTDHPEDSLVAARFRYVMDHWFPPVPDHIYERYVELELVVREVIKAMGNRSG